MKRAARIAVGGAFLLLSAGILAWSLFRPGSGVPLRRSDSRDVDNLMVTPIAETPFLRNQNVLWCASFPLAWDALRRDLLAGSPVVLGPPACGPEVEALNGNPFPPLDLDPSCVVAMAGTGASGIEGRIRAAMTGRAEVNLPHLGPKDLLAFAFLEKDLAFAHPFETIDGGFRFHGPRVRAFGVNVDSENRDLAAVLAQVRVHPSEEDEFIVELLPEGGKDRILLAAVRPEKTLRETWEKVRAASAGPGQPAPPDTVLKIPKFNFDLDHRFRQFEGAAGNIPPIVEARQRTRFRLDEAGASFRSTSTIDAGGEHGTRFVFDRPFLVALVQKGATRPYFLLWVGGLELLARE